MVRIRVNHRIHFTVNKENDEENYKEAILGNL